MQSPSLLVLLLVMIFLTSWIQLNLSVVTEVEATTTTLLSNSTDPQQSFKEKIILSQEKTIQKLREVVQDLQKQLELCRVKTGNSVDDRTIHLTEFLNSNEHEW